MAHYVYMLASGKHGTLYLGVTNDLVRRTYEHKSKSVEGLSKRYDVDKLIWFELCDDPTRIAGQIGTLINNTLSSFRDAPKAQARNPYSRWWLWIPGSSLRDAPE
jgi:hypothetical protein